MFSGSPGFSALLVGLSIETQQSAPCKACGNVSVPSWLGCRLRPYVPNLIEPAVDGFSALLVGLSIETLDPSVRRVLIYGFSAPLVGLSIETVSAEMFASFPSVVSVPSWLGCRLRHRGSHEKIRQTS